MKGKYHCVSTATYCTFCKGFSKEASVFSMASSVTWLVPVSPPLPWNPRAAIYKMVPLYSQWHKFRNVYNQIHLQFYLCFVYLQSTHPKWVDVYGSCASRWIWCKSNIKFSHCIFIKKFNCMHPQFIELDVV